MTSNEYNESRGRCPISHASSISIWGAGVQLMLPCKAFLFRNHSWTSCVRGLHSNTLWLSSWAKSESEEWHLGAVGYRLSKGSVPRAVRWLKSQVYGEVFSDAKSSLECNTSNESARCCTCLIPSAFCACSIILKSFSSLAPIPSFQSLS